MAERRPVIPENQLLDLIQNPSKAQGMAQKQAQQRSWRGFFSPGAWKGRLSFLSAKMAKGRGPSISLGAINRILTFLIIALFIYLIVFFVFAMRSAERVPVFSSGQQKSKAGESESAKVPGEMSTYIDKTHIRDIFKFGDSRIETEEPVAPADEFQDAAPSEESGPLNHLELVGIGFSDDPDVMVKNVQTEEVFFLKRGDWIQGDIKVEAIFRDRVILSYKGKEIELR